MDRLIKLALQTSVVGSSTKQTMKRLTSLMSNVNNMYTVNMNDVTTLPKRQYITRYISMDAGM